MINGVDSPKPKFAAFYSDMVTGARRSAILAFAGRTSRCTWAGDTKCRSNRRMRSHWKSMRPQRQKIHAAATRAYVH